MPTIDIEYKELEQLLHIELNWDMEKLDDILAYVKAEVKGYNKQDETVNIEFKDTNRPDLWSAEGLARALKGFVNSQQRGIKQYSIAKSEVEVFVSRDLYDIRPYIACAVIKEVHLSDAIIRGLMHLQEKLDQTCGRGRRKASIGVYNLDLIKPPIEYTVVKPHEVEFTPLGFTEDMTLNDILEVHPKGCEYGHIIKYNALYPMLFDSEGRILSLPPIINSNDLGKVTEKSQNLLVEVTGTSHKTVLNMLNLVVTMLIDRGGKAYTTTIHYPEDSNYGTVQKQEITPNFDNQHLQLNIEYTNKILGLELTSNRMVELLQTAGFNIEKTSITDIEVLIPCYRTDIMHQVDLIEDIAIAYGYNNIKPNWQELPTVGRAKQDQQLINHARDLMIGLGFQEILNTTLTNKETLFNKTNRPLTPHIEIRNPKVITMTCLRNALLPGLLEVLSNNQSVEFPQKIYEQGKVIHPDQTSETKTLEEEHLAAITTHPMAGFSEIKAVLDSFLSNFDVQWQIKQASQPTFIEGRTGRIIINGDQEIGVI
ncbi:MAG: phenylalanine--tRNA ligase subunit beta, partial [Candidatus Bathyarchaeota archaeon]|nr:phenylalanine--tRNA ligase subunit beta [Candidatus Termiticorpusculum sp.]